MTIIIIIISIIIVIIIINISIIYTSTQANVTSTRANIHQWNRSGCNGPGAKKMWKKLCGICARICKYVKNVVQDLGDERQKAWEKLCWSWAGSRKIIKKWCGMVSWPKVIMLGIPRITRVDNQLPQLIVIMLSSSSIVIIIISW